MKSGIYQIACKINGKRYIGSSKNVFTRKTAHFRELRNSIHPNRLLQNAFNKHGEDNFEFKILAFCEPDFLIEQEQGFLDFCKTYERGIGYNLHKKADSPIGVKRSQEFKDKLSKANTGRKHTEESKKKMSEIHKKLIISDETRRKITESKRGTKLSKAHKEKIGKALKGKYCGQESASFGRKVSEKTRRKLSEATRKSWLVPSRRKRKEAPIG
ncbi:GIY-YIG nuclease family protein [Candidatus Peregrinibacteria bacterium]|jgi:group I intron endonuclease|nr:GIY-YIG nuclease family protein [Candidatus Peregrinibacteria bacterium]